ncbi:MAG: TRAP transporter permease [Pseudomonadota bacterium]
MREKGGPVPLPAEGPSGADIAAIEKFDFGAKPRDLRAWEKAPLYYFCAAYTAFHLAVLNFVALDEWLFRAVHVSGGATIGFTMYSVWRGERRRGVPAWDWVLIALSVYCAGYIYDSLPGLIMRVGVMPTQGDYIVGAIGTALVLEFARRTAGPILPILATLFIAYSFLGSWMPGVLHHRGFAPADFFSFIYSMEGIFGMTTAASSQYIVLFVAFASFLQVSKIGDYFIQLSIALCGWTRGGPAKVAVISGILFGTISGSAVANVVASGTFTIPMMRRVGYTKTSAAAIEATSSTGGQITPPVMGAGAFIMAEITNIPYSDIALAAVIPALLFYVANYAHVDIEAIKQNIHGLPREELPQIKPLLGQICLLTPLVILVMLLLSGYSVIAAGTWGIITAILVMLLHQLRLHSAFLLVPLGLFSALLWSDYEVHPAGAIALGAAAGVALAVGLLRHGMATCLAAIRATIQEAIAGLADGAKQSIQLVAVCACAGIIVGVLGLTGLGGRFSAMILAIAGDSQFLALCFAALIALLLGMGMPTTAAYVIAASVVAPGLQRLGIDPLVAHMFVFYYAVISAITPPVALASFAAAALAQCDPWKASFESVRYGIAAFVVPFMFFYNPELLMKGDDLQIALMFVTAVFGIYFLALASEGWIRGPLNLALRAGLLVAAFLLVAGSLWLDIAGLAIGGGIYAWRYIRSRQARAAA